MSYYIEREMHNGTFETFAEGYATAQHAKNAAKRAFGAGRFVTVVRARNDDTPGEYFQAAIGENYRTTWHLMSQVGN